MVCKNIETSTGNDFVLMTAKGFEETSNLYCFRVIFGRLMLFLVLKLLFLYFDLKCLIIMRKYKNWRLV